MVLECRLLLPVSFLLFHCWCWLTKHTVKRVMVWVFLRLIYIVCVYMLHLIFQVLRLGDLITCDRNAWMSCIFKYMFKRENYNFFVKIEENTFLKKLRFSTCQVVIGVQFVIGELVIKCISQAYGLNLSPWYTFDAHQYSRPQSYVV